MKLLFISLLLVSCAYKPKYSVGQCVTYSGQRTSITAKISSITDTEYFFEIYSSFGAISDFKYHIKFKEFEECISSSVGECEISVTTCPKE